MAKQPLPTIACVAEDRTEWFNRVFTLATSVRNLGGRTASAPLHALFVGSMDGLYEVPLASLGVVSSIVEPWPCTKPQANKLRMLESPEVGPGGVLVALDCDVVVLRDLTDGLSTSAIRATAAWESPMSPQRWHQLLDDVDLRPAPGPWTMIGTGEQVPVPYVNSGVLFIPAEMVDPLRESWAGYIKRLDGARPDRELVFLDQIALALALLDTGLPVEALGQEWNFHTKKDLETAAAPPPGPVHIAHYHRWVDQDGLPKPPRYAPLVPEIERLNAIIAARRGMAPNPSAAASLEAVVQRAAKMVQRGGRAVRR
jgi:hypothetical protein